MADVNTILKIERENSDRIHLFREGLFFKAHQRSAFLFLNNIKDFRVVKKFYKSAGADVVMVGFPSKILETLIDPDKIQEIDQWHLTVACDEPVRENEYQAWFNSIPLLPPSTEKKRHTSTPPELFHEQAPAMTVRLFEPAAPAATGTVAEKVLKELENFSVENSTPMECMVFVSKLKSELKKGRSGCL